jgi:hypothetical protein
MLEASLSQSEDHALRERLYFVENDVMLSSSTASSSENRALRIALNSSLRTEAELRKTVQRLQTEMAELGSSTDRVLAEMGGKVSQCIQEFVATYERNARGVEISAHLERAFERAREDLELKIDSEVKLQLREVSHMNEVLVEELAEREKQLDTLAKQIGMDILCNPSGSQSVASSLRQKAELEATVRRLQREEQLIKLAGEHAKTAVVTEVLGSVAEIGSLKHQIKSLQSLNGVHLQVNRLASLEIMATKSVASKRDLLSLESRVKQLERELHSAQSAVKKAKATALQHESEIKMLKSENVSLKESLDEHRVKQESAAGSVTPVRSSPARSIAQTDRAMGGLGSPPPRVIDPHQRQQQGDHDLQAELQRQREAFERRLKDLEIIAFQRQPSPDEVAMGVIPLKTNPDSARFEAESTLLKHKPQVSNDRRPKNIVPGNCSLLTRREAGNAAIKRPISEARGRNR